MTRRKIRRLRAAIDKLRRAGGVKARELERLAKNTGRKRSPRGKEPAWINENLSDCRPLTIPNHPRDLKRGTVISILDQIEGDVDAMDELADSSDQIN